MIEYIDFLKKSINETMPVSDIVSAFEKMCEEVIDNSMILFETGTFSFTGEPLFYFSLVRQFPDEEEEYYQIYVDILYKPNSRNHEFSGTIWSGDVDENIFGYIRKSKVFEYAKSDKYEKIDIYMDET